jgi:hypothetical protein
VIGTVPSLPSDSDSAQTLDQLLEEDYQDSQIVPDNFTHYSLTQYITPEILKECFSLSKSLHEKGIFSWYSYINHVRTKNTN